MGLGPFLLDINHMLVLVTTVSLMIGTFFIHNGTIKMVADFLGIGIVVIMLTLIGDVTMLVQG